MPELPGHGHRIWMEVFYGAVEISGSRCGVEGCDAEPVAVQPIRTSEETGVRWLCREHTDELQAVPDDLPTAVRLINPTCAMATPRVAVCRPTLRSSASRTMASTSPASVLAT